MKLAKRGFTDHTILLTDMENNKQQLNGISLILRTTQALETSDYNEIKLFLAPEKFPPPPPKKKKP
jgi:hypothetical protein